jgi:tetratricopeptide (TPR) repeat protein
MSGLLPTGHQGNILYTSRNPLLRELSPDAVCEVAELEKDQAVELLLAAARLQAPASEEVLRLAEAIVDELGSLALAVSQAGAFMALGECRIHDFLATFKNRRAQLFSVNAYKDAATYERAVYATWDLSYSAIQRKSSKGDRRTSEAQTAANAIQLLNMLAFLHYENVTEDIFWRAAGKANHYSGKTNPCGKRAPEADLPLNLLPLDRDGEWNSQHYRQAIRLLGSFSLVTVNPLSGSLSMHRLVHSWTLDRQLPHVRKAYLRSSAATLAYSVPSSDDRTLLRNLVPHLATLHQLAVDHRLDPFPCVFKKENIVQVYEYAERWKDSENLRRAILKSEEELLGPEHFHVLISMGNLAVAVGKQGRVAEAEALHRKVLRFGKKVLGYEHPQVITCMNNLASAVGAQGRETESAELHWQAFELGKKVLGPEHPNGLVSMGNVAVAVAKQGRVTEAEELQWKVLELGKKVLGPEHPDVLNSMSNLGSTVEKEGQVVEAEELHRQVLELRRDELGPEHPDVLASMGNLASTLGEQGRFVEAEKLLRQALELRKKVLGPEHPDVLTSMNNLASTVGQQGRWAEAEELHRLGLQLSRRVLGREHPDVITCMNNLAPAVREQG